MTQMHLEQEARDLTTKAEHGTKADLQDVHEHLAKDMGQMSAKDYGQLLKLMSADNAADVTANKHLPKIDFFSSTPDGGVNDSVKTNYSTDTAGQARSAAPDDHQARQPQGESLGNDSADRKLLHNRYDYAPSIARGDDYPLSPSGRNGLESKHQPIHVTWPDGTDTAQKPDHSNGLESKHHPSSVTWSDGTTEKQESPMELLNSKH